MLTCEKNVQIQAYVPIAQLPVTAQGPSMEMLIASRDPAMAQLDVGHMLNGKYPGMQIQFQNFHQGIVDKLVGDRMMARLSGFFGFLAALLVVVGLHGVLSYFLAQRRREIGIRMALGASRGHVVATMLRSAFFMLLAGLVAGTVLALVRARSQHLDLRLKAVGSADPRWRCCAAGGGYPGGEPGSVDAGGKCESDRLAAR